MPHLHHHHHEEFLRTSLSLEELQNRTNEIVGSSGLVLSVRPERFRLPFGSKSSVLVVLENKNKRPIAYCVDNTSPSTLIIEPADGCIAPGSEARVVVNRPRRVLPPRHIEHLIFKIKYCNYCNYGHREEHQPCKRNKYRNSGCRQRCKYYDSEPCWCERDTTEKGGQHGTYVIDQNYVTGNGFYVDENRNQYAQISQDESKQRKLVSDEDSDPMMWSFTSHTCPKLHENGGINGDRSSSGPMFREDDGFHGKDHSDSRLLHQDGFTRSNHAFAPKLMSDSSREFGEKEQRDQRSTEQVYSNRRHRSSCRHAANEADDLEYSNSGRRSSVHPAGSKSKDAAMIEDYDVGLKSAGSAQLEAGVSMNDLSQSENMIISRGASFQKSFQDDPVPSDEAAFEVAVSCSCDECRVRGDEKEKGEVEKRESLLRRMSRRVMSSGIFTPFRKRSSAPGQDNCNCSYCSNGKRHVVSIRIRDSREIRRNQIHFLLFILVLTVGLLMATCESNLLVKRYWHGSKPGFWNMWNLLY